MSASGGLNQSYNTLKAAPGSLSGTLLAQHGVYSRVPAGARILQRSRRGEVVSWESHAHGGTLLAATTDPIIEHGVQQIRHLDNFVDQLVFWLCDRRPRASPLVLAADQFGTTPAAAA